MRLVRLSLGAAGVREAFVAESGEGFPVVGFLFYFYQAGNDWADNNDDMS